MTSEFAGLRLLLDEHYPGWLARDLTAAGVDTVALTADRPGLRGADDVAVLRHTAKDRRVVVTEDVRTFAIAIQVVADHVGVVFCHHTRYPRTATRVDTAASGPRSRWPPIRPTASDACRSSGGCRCWTNWGE